MDQYQTLNIPKGLNSQVTTPNSVSTQNPMPINTPNSSSSQQNLLASSSFHQNMTRLTTSNNNNKPSSPSSSTVKFLYSYGGKILPRVTDGKLVYTGGHTRILTVDRSISLTELTVKLFEACGSSVNLKVKLPYEDLDVLVSVTSDEDLGSVVEEYEEFAPGSKIRAVLFPVGSLKTVETVKTVGGLVKKQRCRRFGRGFVPMVTRFGRECQLNMQWCNEERLGFVR